MSRIAIELMRLIRLLLANGINTIIFFSPVYIMLDSIYKIADARNSFDRG